MDLPMNDEQSTALARTRQEVAQNDREEFEAEAAVTRHLFPSARAAVRLLAGAYAFREVTDEEYGDGLSRVAAAGGIELDVPVHQIRLSRCRQRLGLPTYHERLRNIARGRGVLAVVADPDGSGWAEFFEAVFGGVRVAVVDPTTAEHILRDPDDLAIVFHDLSCGDGPDGRVGVVGAIKRAHFDLPVVVFSDREDVREMWQCLRVGASGYFCYEPGPGHDRESVATFEQFAGIVRDAIPPESWRRIWQELREFTGPTPHSQGSRLYRRAVGHLRRAYLFLTSDKADPRTRLLAANDPAQRFDAGGLARHVVMACGSAIETVLRHTYREHNRRCGASERIIQNLTWKVPDMVAVLAEADLVGPELAGRFREVWRVRNVAVHEERVGVTQAEAEDALSQTIALLRDFFARFDDTTELDALEE
jgi:hypothetical protein